MEYYRVHVNASLVTVELDRWSIFPAHKISEAKRLTSAHLLSFTAAVRHSDTAFYRPNKDEIISIKSPHHYIKALGRDIKACGMKPSCLFCSDILPANMCVCTADVHVQYTGSRFMLTLHMVKSKC